MTDEFLTVPKFAAKLGKPKMTLYRWIKAGKVAHVEFGGVKFVPTSELKRLCQELNITKITLDGLRRTKEFPFYRLTERDRIYSVKEVADWLRQHKRVS